MLVVALAALHGPAEAEAQPLAQDLGVTAFEAGQHLRGALPAIVLRTPDVAKAQKVLRGLRARGHEAVGCDTAAVSGGEGLHWVREFRFDPDAFVSLNPNGTSERLPWGELVALVRAAHHSIEQTTETTKEKQFDMKRAVLTQGLSMSKTVTKTTTKESREREPVVYLFRRAGPPWIFGEVHGRYGNLGSELKPSRLENFNTVVRLLRERAPAVPFDERLSKLRSGTDQSRPELGAGGAQVSTTDLLAHLVMLYVARRA